MNKRGWRRAPKQILRKEMQSRKPWQLMPIMSAAMRPLVKAVRAMAAGIQRFSEALRKALEED